MAEVIEECYMAMEKNKFNSGSLTWILDTGASTSLTRSAELLTSYEAVSNKFIGIADGSKLPVKGKGVYYVAGPDGTYTIPVFHVPAIAANLLAARAFTANGGRIELTDTQAVVFDKAGDVVLAARRDGTLYRCSLLPAGSSKSKLETGLVADVDLIHRRFGHVDLSKAKGLDSSSCGSSCDACLRGKFKRIPFNETPPAVTVPLAQVHADLFGPTRVATAGGAVYLCVFVDAATRFARVYYLKNKSESTAAFVDYKAFVEKQTKYRIRRLRTDGGKEFDNQRIWELCEKQGIEYITNTPYSSQQNGMAERRIGIILNDTRTLLLDSGLSARFWGYASAHSVYLRNRIPNPEGISPHQAMFGRKPRLDHLVPFGCAAYAWIPPVNRKLGKLNARSIKTVFIGFQEGTSNSLLYCPTTREFMRSRDVRYLETVFPATGQPTPDLSFLNVQWEKKSATSEKEHLSHSSSDEESDFIVRPSVGAAKPDSASPSPPPHPSPSPSPPPAPPRGTIVHSPMQDYNPDGGDMSDDELALLAGLAGLEVPKTMRAALDGADGAAWKVSMQDELNSIDKAGTWELVDRNTLPDGTKLIDSRFVLDIKLDPSGGNLHRLKTRLVARGFTQRYGYDYLDTFSPVGHRQSLRIMFAIAASEDLELKAVDITTAFLHGVLEETIYMKLPAEIAGGINAGKVAKLRKALYGLKQAGRCWNEELDKWLESTGWEANPDDGCVYIMRISNGTIKLMLYVHVDDSLIAGKIEEDIEDFINQLHARFPCKRQGDAKYFLGMEIHRDRASRTLWLTQQQYTSRILERFGLTDCRTFDIPLSPGVLREFVPPPPELIAEAKHLPYRELVGSLQYAATMTRPDITYAVSQLAAFNNGWSERQFEIAKGVLRYVAGTRLHGLRLGGTLALRGFVDADYAGDKSEFVSRTGWLVTLGGTVAWKSRKQSVQAHSSAESEYMAVDDIARDMVWERRNLETLGYPSSGPTQVAIDNQAAIRIAKNRVTHDSIKHIAIKYHYIRGLVRKKILRLDYIETRLNHADFLTKPLAREKFVFHRNAIGIQAPPSSGSVEAKAMVEA